MENIFLVMLLILLHAMDAMMLLKKHTTMGLKELDIGRIISLKFLHLKFLHLKQEALPEQFYFLFLFQ